ncbi:hypothetical protein GF345_00130 [Candidatus Woesearchaeota archaeon]|nr:hypothetical protein [Candidatus Woesearchaeota archaeon]
MRKVLIVGFCGIRNQNTLGSCTAMSITSVIEYIRNRTNGWYTKSEKAGKWLSPRYVYFNIREFIEEDYTHTPDERIAGIAPVYTNKCPHHSPYIRDMDTGGHSLSIKDALVNYGACKEDTVQYHDDATKCVNPFQGFEDTGRRDGHFKEEWALQPDPNAYEEGNSIFREVVDNVELHPVSRLDIPNLIVRDELPVCIGIFTPADFTSQGFTYYQRDAITRTIGGHQVVIVGYDDNYPDPRTGKRVRAYMIRNSWGDAWGNKGYCWIEEETLKKIIEPNAVIITPRQRFKPWPGKDPAPPEPIPPGSGDDETDEDETDEDSEEPDRSGEFQYRWYTFDNARIYNYCRQNHILPGRDQADLIKEGYENRDTRFSDGTFDPARFSGRLIALAAAYSGHNYWVWCYWDPESRSPVYTNYGEGQETEGDEGVSDEDIRSIPKNLKELDSKRKKIIKALSDPDLRFDPHQKLHFHDKESVKLFNNLGKLIGGLLVANNIIAQNLKAAQSKFQENPEFASALSDYAKHLQKNFKDIMYIAEILKPISDAYESGDQDKIDQLEADWDPKKINESLERIETSYPDDSEHLERLGKIIKKLSEKE